MKTCLGEEKQATEEVQLRKSWHCEVFARIWRTNKRWLINRSVTKDLRSWRKSAVTFHNNRPVWTSFTGNQVKIELIRNSFALTRSFRHSYGVVAHKLSIRQRYYVRSNGNLFLIIGHCVGSGVTCYYSEKPFLLTYSVRWFYNNNIQRRIVCSEKVWKMFNR